ncbi:MAG TPA: DinB family protein [Vicinamibacterales bacterium]|nr:DinB family protein [Vicinamibacterales bacterium]
MTAAPSWVSRLLQEIDDADARATRLAAGLTAGQLNWKPTAQEWSVGQCLDHLCVANDVYLASIARSFEGQPRAVASDITPGWFGRWFIRNYIEPSAVTKRGRAPRKIVPGSAVDASILDRFLATNQALRDHVRRASEYDVNRIRFKNPFVAGIRFTVGTGFEILVRHQRRHLLQAERVAARDGFPGLSQ